MFISRKKRNARISEALMRTIASDKAKMNLYMGMIDDLMKSNEGNFDQTVESMTKVLITHTCESSKVCEPVAQTLTIVFINEHKKRNENCWRKYIG